MGMQLQDADYWFLSNRGRYLHENPNLIQKSGHKIRIALINGRWTSYTEWCHGRKAIHKYNAIIVFRYYTVNKRWKNYHARVLILDGKYSGRKVSIRV